MQAPSETNATSITEVFLGAQKAIVPVIFDTIDEASTRSPASLQTIWPLLFWGFRTSFSRVLGEGRRGMYVL